MRIGLRAVAPWVGWTAGRAERNRANEPKPRWARGAKPRERTQARGRAERNRANEPKLGGARGETAGTNPSPGPRGAKPRKRTQARGSGIGPQSENGANEPNTG